MEGTDRRMPRGARQISWEVGCPHASSSHTEKSPPQGHFTAEQLLPVAQTPVDGQGLSQDPWQLLTTLTTEGLYLRAKPPWKPKLKPSAHAPDLS